ncbi:MAG: YkgJ family cysteine cluster protein [Candidatus Heimdallarchaeaceae archaeon]
MKDQVSRKEICSKHCGSKCCRSTPPALTSEDFLRIKKNLKIDEYISKVEKEDQFIYLINKKQESEECIFLTEEFLCKIYDYRPLDCILFPIFLKIKKSEEDRFSVKWLVWYCPLTDKIGVDNLKQEARKKALSILAEQPQILFEYQNAMNLSGGYKRKHFLNEENLTITKSE